MVKVTKLGESLWMWCPACGTNHRIDLDKHHWNYDLNYPTVQPTVTFDPGHATQCHFFIENGFIHYLTDCKHSLAGQVVEMMSHEYGTIPTEQNHENHKKDVS